MSSANEILKGTFEFTNLGRQKVSKTAELNGVKSFWKALEGHFMSKDIEYWYDPVANEGKIIVGGFREVGQFRRVQNG